MLIFSKKIFRMRSPQLNGALDFSPVSLRVNPALTLGKRKSKRTVEE